MTGVSAELETGHGFKPSDATGPFFSFLLCTKSGQVVLCLSVYKVKSCHLSSTGVLISKACITAGAPRAWHTLLGEHAEVEATPGGCSYGGQGGSTNA